MRKANLVPATDADLFYIAANMRAADRAEIYATRWTDDPSALTDDCMIVVGCPSSWTVVARLGSEPVAVMGAVEPWPGAWDVWCFGTDMFDRVALTMTKYIRRTFIPLLLARGLRRAHCRSMAGHDRAHAWLRLLGAKPSSEQPMRNWGKNGEDFVMFEWHREDLLKLYKAEAA
jgi:hypothetical protein